MYNVSMRDEYKETGLPDLPNPSLVERRKEEQKVVDDIKKREEETGMELEVVVADRPEIKMPVRVAYQQEKIDLGKLPIWYLQAMGSMTMEEYNTFLKEHHKDLTLNELIASDFIAKVLNKDASATERFWRLQEKLLNRQQVIQQVNNITVKPDAVMTDLLNGIEAELLRTAGKSEDPHK